MLVPIIDKKTENHICIDTQKRRKTTEANVKSISYSTTIFKKPKRGKNIHETVLPLNFSKLDHHLQSGE